MREIDIEIDHECLALDRRSVSVDGHLTVTDCLISAVQVNPYLGRELPGYDTLGLEPERVYHMLRDPAALKAAVPLFNGVPLLLEHEAVSAASPKQHLIAGAVSEPYWQDGKVLGTVSVWTSEAIDGIESRLKKDLSAAYHYVPRMTPGTYKGEHYDGRMTAIGPINHVALVQIGRVEGAMVADAALDQRAVVERIVPHFYRL